MKSRFASEVSQQSPRPVSLECVCLKLGATAPAKALLVHSAFELPALMPMNQPCYPARIVLLSAFAGGEAGLRSSWSVDLTACDLFVGWQF